MRVSRSLTFHLETKMPWRQTPSRKKKAIVFTTVTANAYQDQIKKYVKYLKFTVGVGRSDIQDRYRFDTGIFCWIGVSVWRDRSKFDILHS